MGDLVEFTDHRSRRRSRGRASHSTPLDDAWRAGVLPPAVKALASLPRDRLELLAEAIIAILDATSPDPDREFDAEEACDALEDQLEFSPLDIHGAAGDPTDAEDGGDREPQDEHGTDEMYPYNGRAQPDDEN
jgi:hypothetical protein